MSDTVIQVEGLGKRYRLGERRTGYKTIRESLTAAARRGLSALTRRNGYHTPRADSDFWALRDVSFEVKQGEVVGIIGRNGAGKSTLLKILSRITEPTTGQVRIRGRVGSLLEVGTGFHPELTGRENIYLNGAILGMSKAEIDRKFEEIVAFADVERFVDTPVKRHSTGMYLRLAFAVAAHLESEILVVDEVLAVGDADFQRKSLGRMGEIAAGGRTVLFVSHNMTAINQLCTQALILHNSRLYHSSANVSEVVKCYLDLAVPSGSSFEWRAPHEYNRHTNPYFTPLRLAFRHEDGRPIQHSASKQDSVWIEIEARIQRTDPALTVGYALYAENGTLLYSTYQTDAPRANWPTLNTGTVVLTSKLPDFLNEGTYRAELIGGLHCREWLFEPGSGTPTITLTIQGGLSDSPLWSRRRPGPLGPAIRWYSK